MKIPTEVLEVLSRCSVSTKQLELPEQLDRKLYVKVAKVIEEAGGEWNRRMKRHSFERDGADAEAIIENILLTGEINGPKSFEYFPTPPNVVARMMGLSGVQRGDFVLEPSAGRGAIACAARGAGARVLCVELDPQNDKNLREQGFETVSPADFLTLPPKAEFSHVIMNPPFSKQQDIDHVLHAYRFLKSSGRLVSVMASGVTFRSNRRSVDFREFVNENGGSIEPLPADSFKVSGTSVNTVLVFIPKESK